MSRLINEFGASNPDDVVLRGGEAFVAAERVGDVIDAAEQQDVRLLGMEGFIIDGAKVYPALGRVVDFSTGTPEAAIRSARQLLASSWASPPTSRDQLHSAAVGRHMVAVMLED